MRKPIILVPSTLLLIATTGLPAQTGRLLHPMLRSGISIEFGAGRYSMRDEYFSRERYSGTLPQFAASWSRLNESGGYSLGIVYRSCPNLHNNNMTAGVTHFSLNLDYVYRVATLRPWAREARLYLGPSTGLFLYFSDLHIAYSELEIPYSFALMLPLGVRSTIVMPVSRRFQLAGAARTTVFSLGLRMVNLVEDGEEQTPLRFLTPPTGANASVGLGVRYALVDRLSLNARYELQLLRIRSWDPLLSASDNLLAGVTLGF